MPKPLPTLEWLHVCDHAFRDEHGKLCLIGLFEALHTFQLPGFLPVYSVAIGLTDGQGEYRIGLHIQAPSGKTIDLALPPVVLKDRHAKARAVIRLASMRFEEFGRYTFRLAIDGTPIDYPVHVVDHLEARPGPAPAPHSGETQPPGQ